MDSLANPTVNGNTASPRRVVKRYEQIPNPDDSTIAPGVQIIAEAARSHFRRCYAIRPRDHYDESYARFELMVRLAVDKAMRAEWERCEAFAQQIADDAVRRAYALEIQS